MSSAYPALVLSRKSGDERFQYKGKHLGFDLRGFWQWSASDLVSNAMRGVLAEYIVAQALGLAGGIRNEWDSFDLRTNSGLKVEVKSASYVQTWYQKKLSAIAIVVGPRQHWDPETNILERERKWQADVYVFAVLKHEEKSTIDPLNLDQWEFYVLPVSVLENRKRSQHSITLKSLRTLCPSPVGFDELSRKIELVVTANNTKTS